MADNVILMEDFTAVNATARAKGLCGANTKAGGNIEKAEWHFLRRLTGDGFTSFPQGSGTERLEISDTGFLLIGGEMIGIRAFHNLASPAQLNAIALIIRNMEIMRTEQFKKDKI